MIIPSGGNRVAGVVTSERTAAAVARISSVVCLSVWLAWIISWLAGSVAGSRRGPVSRQLIDVPGDLHPGGDEHDQVVADPLQVGHQVRGHDDADQVKAELPDPLGG